jgi:colicin import membrane protein
VDVQVSANCPYDQLGKRSLEAAVLKASPLPYAGFEDVFRRDLILTFRPEDVEDLRGR